MSGWDDLTNDEKEDILDLNLEEYWKLIPPEKKPFLLVESKCPTKLQQEDWIPEELQDEMVDNGEEYSDSDSEEESDN